MKTHEFVVGFLEDSVMRLKRIAPGERVNVRSRSRDVIVVGDSKFLIVWEHPSYLLLRFLPEPWNRPRADFETIVRRVDANILEAISPEEFHRVLPELDRWSDEDTVLTENAEERPKADASENVELNVGQQFRLRLKALPSTGYTWTFFRRPEERILKILGSEQEPVEDEAPGSTHEYFLVFQAVAAGETDIVLHFVPPAGSDPEAVREIRIRVK
jgi:predicted secreted protein